MGGGSATTGDGGTHADGHDEDAGRAAGDQAPPPVPPAPAPASVPARVDPAEAEVADKTTPVPLVAPPWTGRVYYLVGGTLPKTYSAWVSRDLTAPGWRRRQAARTGLLLLPVACVFALLPGPVGVRATIVVFIAATALGLGFGAAGYFRNRRLLQHGFPPVFPKNDD